MVSVRQATLDDKQKIFEFIRLAYPNRWKYKIPERWEWEFELNPFCPPGQLPIWMMKTLALWGKVVPF